MNIINIYKCTCYNIHKYLHTLINRCIYPHKFTSFYNYIQTYLKFAITFSLSQINNSFLLVIFYKYQASECGNGFGCFRRPENCTGEDCEYLITYRAAENMSNYVDITMTTKWQWIGLGHNMVPQMVNYTFFKPLPKTL